eukprot:TRINITY_DN56886_c0_g1_i1.p1 TRINITY_DN56886_c0_g1~~TRINITY_DN56886_c0_g1_i1.p1  ORF type:complete len:270 (+),score=28.36 TRINITY_DN56886_c0_g1_i1:59-868(+)
MVGRQLLVGPAPPLLSSRGEPLTPIAAAAAAASVDTLAHKPFAELLANVVTSNGHTPRPSGDPSEFMSAAGGGAAPPAGRIRRSLSRPPSVGPGSRPPSRGPSRPPSVGPCGRGSASRASSCSTRECSGSDAGRGCPSSCSSHRESSESSPASQLLARPEFFRHMPRGREFSPRVGFLEAKPVGNGSQWDQERLLLPERAYPRAADKKVAAAELYDENPDRASRPDWKPTIANRRTGVGTQIGAAFPMLPPRPRSANRTPRPRALLDVA